MHIPFTSGLKSDILKELQASATLKLKYSSFPLFFNGYIRRTFRTVSSTPSSDCRYEDFYRYTSGRWLWDEQKQLQRRYKKFNVHELIQAATRSVGARDCVSITKLAEGGYNKVFRLVMNDGAVVMARIPNSCAGPPFKTIASEVAAMDFARNILSIPVPKVLSWSGKDDNPVGSEYILMQEAIGTQLGEIWDEMDICKKKIVVDQVIDIEKKLLSLSFTLYGNLYLKSDAFPGCEPADVTGDVLPSLKREVRDRFVIGPVVDRAFWDGERSTMDIDRGPWCHHVDFLKAIPKREIAWLKHHATVKPEHSLVTKSEAQSSVEAHIAIYKKFNDVADFLLPNKKKYVTATLWHWDIHASNLFINKDTTEITGLIDWQDTWVGPLFLQARHPRLVDYNGEILLRLPDSYETIADKDEKAKIGAQVEKSILIWAYEDDTREVNPILHEIFHVRQGRTRRDTVNMASNTWDDEIIPFRQCLINIERNWPSITSSATDMEADTNTESDIPCPIHFTDADLALHARDSEGWNDNADFWSSLEGLVDRDGFTTNEKYDQAVEYFRQLRERGLGMENLSAKERAELDRQTRFVLQD